MLQIGAAMFYYNLGHRFLQTGEASLLQIGAKCITNWGRYNKLGQNVLQIGAGITNYSNYYKLEHSTYNKRFRKRGCNFGILREPW